jgi:hypothetical protein
MLQMENMIHKCRVGCNKGAHVYTGVIVGTIVYAYDIEGSLQGICLKVMVSIGE